MIHPINLSPGAIPIGLIEWETTMDKYNNPVSLITMAHGSKFRMVHFATKSPNKRANIYAGRGKFVRVTYNEPQSDTVATEINVAGYAVSWGDGENLGAESNPSGPDLTKELKTIQEDDFDAVILLVLSRIEYLDNMWEIKPLRSQIQSK